jgi:nicotinate dehydrogenase subunit B
MNAEFNEPERYELTERPMWQFDLTRREFVKSAAAGIVILMFLDPAEAQEARRRGGGGGGAQELSAWLHIAEDGSITVYTGKVEVGQNIRTSLTQVVADELNIPASSIQLVMGDTALVPFDAGTFGSRTTPVMARQLRQAAAAARELLLDLAAAHWKSGRTALKVEGTKVLNTSKGESIGFGELTRGQKLSRAVSESVSTKPATQWKISGQSFPKIGGREFVTGKHQYSSDLSRPGMLHGKILRAPAFGAQLESIDTSAAETMPGVTVVRDGNFLGVTAPSEFVAAQALAAIRAEWKRSPQVSQRDLFEHLKQEGGGAGSGRGGGHRAGSMEEGLASADVKRSETYTVDYIAHAPLEPRAAVAEWQGDSLTVWTGTQRPFGVRSELASAFRIPEEKVRVIMPDTGSAYGGKHTGEAAVEAARLARDAGKPVKVVWTREEEFTWAYFRPAGVIEVSSGAQKNGLLTAWEFHNWNSGASSIRTLYEVPHQRIEFHSSRSPLRQGSYRTLASTANHFARETHMDELAHALKLDPLEFRLKNLKDPRLRAVFEAAAEKFGWSTRRPDEGHGFGMGGGFEKGGYVATFAEVAVDRDSGRVKVVRAVTAFECGAVINPDHLESQVDGCVMMGLGGALFEQIDFADGKILNPRFSSYRVPRFSDTPLLETVLLDRKDLPSAGAGETPIVGIAPAIGNAIYHATGVRLRSLPLVPKGLPTKASPK